MFFNISQTKLSNFPYHYRHNNLVVNLDAGWNEIADVYNNKIFYKGYVDEANIHNCILDIAQQEEPGYVGNFCVIKCFDQGVAIKTDKYRSFPLWFDSIHGLTNLTKCGDPIHTDSFAMITNSGELVESKFDAIGTIYNDTLSLQTVIDRVDLILSQKIQNFVNNNRDRSLYVFLSGGIDTMLLYSYVRKFNVPHKLIRYLHTDLDYFFLKNHQTIHSFWGFRQAHHWEHPCVLLSGAPGDEFTLRSPTTANMMLRYHGTGIDELIKDQKNSLHYSYFVKYLDLFNQQAQIKFDSFTQAVDNCLNMILNDYQHWHIGNTYYFTPYRDTEIFKTIARLPKEDLINQIFASIIQIKIITKNAPELLAALSTQKNTANYMENLSMLYNELPQDSIRLY